MVFITPEYTDLVVTLKFGGRGEGSPTCMSYPIQIPIKSHISSEVGVPLPVIII